MNTIKKAPSKLDKKLIIFYILCIAFCVFAIFVAMYVEFFADENMGLAVGITNNLSNDQYNDLKKGFDELFDNKLNNGDYLNDSIIKKEKNNDIVFNSLTKIETTDSYDVNVKIPYINIDNDVANKFNYDIKSTFEDKLNSIIEKQKGKIIYTVEYTAYINGDILSVMIRSNLKEGNNAQRVIIQTYNYDLKNNTEYQINNVLKMRNINEEAANKKIQTEIKSIQEQVESLSDLGYTIFNRNLSDDMYKVMNTTEFFIGKDNYLYIIYAYGNYNNTSEMDLVIL